MDLKYLVISDTHVGEPNSFLSFPRGLQKLWYELKTKLGDGTVNGPKIKVDELILLGDIPDRTLSPTSAIQTYAPALMRILLSVLELKKVVYVPGNHDHTLWTEYLATARPAGSNKWDITPPCGEVVINPQIWKTGVPPAADDLLSIFFEFPYGDPWADINKALDGGNSFEFVLANPLYAQEFNNRMYVFTHGHYFRFDVCFKEIVKQAFAMSIDSWAGLDVKPGGDVRDVTSLKSYERNIYPFVDSLWPSAGNNPMTRAEALWMIRRELKVLQGVIRPTPQQSVLIPWADLPGASPGIANLIQPGASPDAGFGDDGLKRLQKFALRHMLRHVDSNLKPLAEMDGLTFVYGDTHDGGFGEVGLDLKTMQMVARPSPGSPGTIEMNIANTGAWIMEYPGTHPAAHVFAVDQAGGAHFLDVSFTQITISQQPLMNVIDEQIRFRLAGLGTALLDKIKAFVAKFRNLIG